jgi:uncharacterized protein (TIGR03086 family)
MTSTTKSQSPSPSNPSPYEPDDPRTVFAKAVATGATVVAQVRPDQLGGPTPCADLDVRALLDHIVFVLRRVAAIGRGEDAMAVPPLAEPVADDGWVAAYAAGTREVQDAWTDAAALVRTVTLPWATFPGAAALASYSSELTTHTWDLATAIGAQPAWDEQVLAVSLASIRAGLPVEGRIALFDAITDRLPPGARSMGYPFGEAVAVPDDAPLIDQLVAYTGRRPG